MNDGTKSTQMSFTEYLPLYHRRNVETSEKYISAVHSLKKPQASKKSLLSCCDFHLLMLSKGRGKKHDTIGTRTPDIETNWPNAPSFILKTDSNLLSSHSSSSVLNLVHRTIWNIHYVPYFSILKN